jgi:hypothetical protein
MTAPAITLHLTLLTSHYRGAAEADEGAAVSGVAGGHKKDATSGKTSVTAPKATGKEKETYMCRTSAEQLDSVARGLRAVLQHFCDAPSAGALGDNGGCHSIALQAHRVQLAKAVRDGAIPWAEVAHELEEMEVGVEDTSTTTARATSSAGTVHKPKLSTSSLLSDPPVMRASTKPVSRSSSRGRSGSSSASNGVNRHRTFSGTSRKGSTFPVGPQTATDAETPQWQQFLDSQLPLCEVVTVPPLAAAVSAETAAASVSVANNQSPFPSLPSAVSYPVFFLYHVASEEEVVAALATLNSAEGGAFGNDADTGATAERERRRARAGQAATLVTRAMWCALRPALRYYLHSTGATVVPSHISVVWAVAEPCLLEGLNSYSDSAYGDRAESFIFCPSTMSTGAVSAEGTHVRDGEETGECWVRLMPRNVAYLYTPLSLPGSGSANVEATLAALKADRAPAGGQCGLAEANMAKTGNRRGSTEGGPQNTQPLQRGNQAASSGHKAGGRAAGGPSHAMTAANKGRSGNNSARGDAPSTLSTATAIAANVPLSNVQADPADAAASVAVVDFDAEPYTFPYCTVDATSLACYLYAGCGSVADGTTPATPAQDLRGKAVTSFVVKAAAYQRAVLSTVSSKTLVDAKAGSALRVTAEVLTWVQAFLAGPVAREEQRDREGRRRVSNCAASVPSLLSVTDSGGGGGSDSYAVPLCDVAKTSLAKTLLEANRWPIPCWGVAAVPLATVPPLALRSADRNGNNSKNDSGGSHESAVKEGSTTQTEPSTLPAFIGWARSVLERHEANVAGSATAARRGSEVGLLLRQIVNIGCLADAYAAWAQQSTPARHPLRTGLSRSGPTAKETATEADSAVRFTHDSFTGGVFTLLNGTAALMAEASRSLCRQKPPQALTAVCASSYDAPPPLPGEQTEEPQSAGLSSSLFARYRNPFQRLCTAHDSSGRAAETAVVPRSLPATAGTAAGRCTVITADTAENADVVHPPYPQDVQAMVHHIVAKNTGHFEVNTTHGTDTITAVVVGCGAGGSAMVDSTMTGSFSPAARQGVLNTATQSTGLLLRQQQQQQRRRQREQGGGSVAAALRTYVYGVRLVKEVSKAHLGQRPSTEAAVLLQEALESTLATPREWAPATIPSCCSSDPQEQVVKAYVVKVNALDLLQRYLSCNDPHFTTPSSHGTPLGPAKTIKWNDGALSVANAASAAAQSLTPRVYEHCLQQVLLGQLLREAGLEQQDLYGVPGSPKGIESSAENWTVTEQVSTEAIVPALVNFRERFGAHNVAVVASTLDYHLQSPAPPAPSTLTDKAMEEADEIHQTSAYAHNALNVHPARRVTQLWMVGVVLPSCEDTLSGGASEQCNIQKSRGDPQRSPPFNRCRARRWVEMVPHAGTVTPIEVYAVWRLLLQQQQPTEQENTEKMKKPNAAAVGESVAPAAAESSEAPLILSARLAQQLLRRYVQRRVETSTALVRRTNSVTDASTEADTSSVAPMRFCTHETLYPYGDALLEVWSGETQRTCRYIKAAEVTAALHSGARSPGIPTPACPLHLSVRWDDGLLFSCSTAGTQQTSAVPVIDVWVTTSNVVLQRRAKDARLLLRRYPNTSSCATATGVAAAHESSRQPVSRPPQGLLGDACTLLFEARTTLFCVHDALPVEEPSNTPNTGAKLPEATIEVTLEEAEVSCEVDERTGVIHHVYPSGAQLLQLPSGAMLTRRPITSSDGVAATCVAKQAAVSATALSPPESTVHQQQWCETLITCDGRCFVRQVHGNSYSDPAVAAATSFFRRVKPHMRKDGQAPAFTRAENSYDAVRHCNVCSRQDGLTVVEYSSLASNAIASAGTPAVVARVVVFPDGTSITTLAPRDVRQRLLSDASHATTARGGASGTTVPAAVALSSPSLCAMLEEVEAVEGGLFGPGAAEEALGNSDASGGERDRHRTSVRWLVEAPTLPRFYLAPPRETEANRTAFSVVFGDGTVLQRHWVPAGTANTHASDLTPSQHNTNTVSSAPRSAQHSTNGRGSTATVSDESLTQGGGASSSVYNGGSVATVLIRPSTSAVRVLHEHAVVTIEPADVLASTTHASPAAYAVGQGMPFFDLAYGGGMRLVDAARFVWEVRGLSASAGPKVLYPYLPRTYQELLRELVSTHYSPQRLSCAAELAHATEQQRERVAYARQRASGWCPPLVRRLRELSEPYIRAANLLRTDVLAPMESDVSAAVETRRAAFIHPVCFGQLANGESIRYWGAGDVIPRPTSADTVTASVSAVANEPHVLQRVVPSVSVGAGVLQYTCSAPSYASAAEVMAVLSAGSKNGAVSDGNALSQRLAEARRLSLLCVGGLAPSIPPPLYHAGAAWSSQRYPFADTYASTLPPSAVLVPRGCRWLPPALQPPQQFSSAYSKTVVHAVAAQSDMVWAHDATTAASGAASAYIQYMMEWVDPTVSPMVLRTAVARRERRRYEELAQLSRYHRVLTSQWPMEQPNTAREEQVRLEMHYNEAQRARRLPPSKERSLLSPSAPSEANAVGLAPFASRLEV